MGQATKDLELADREAFNEARKDFLFGTDKDKEDFLKKYSVDDALDIISQEMRDIPSGGGGSAAYKEELRVWKERLFERKGGRGTPMSQAARDLGVG